MQEGWLYDDCLLEFWVSVLKYWQHSSAACCPGGSALASHTAELYRCSLPLGHCRLGFALLALLKLFSSLLSVSLKEKKQNKKQTNKNSQPKKNQVFIL